MNIKRQSNFLESKVLLGVTVSLVVLFMLTILRHQSTGLENRIPANKLEEMTAFQVQNEKALGFEAFLNTYAQEGYTILLISYDDIRGNLSQVNIKLRDLGSKQMNTLTFRDSYVAVIENGKVIKEKRSSDSLVSISHHNFQLKGMGYGKKRVAGMAAGIEYVEDFTDKRTSFTKNMKRGLYALVYKNNDDFIKETIAYHFDLYSEKDPVSKGLKKIFIPLQDKLTIEMEEKDFDRIKEKRKEALDLGLLLTYDDDWVPARINFQGKEYKAQVRLKGDWTDHLTHRNKWSYKVKLDNGTVFGTNKFSVQTAASRNFMGEWMFHQLLKKGDVVALRYSFLKAAVTIRGKDDAQPLYNNVGVMAFEEGFTKYLLENNKRKESVIIKINESLGWEDFKKGGRSFSNPTLPIIAFEMGKVLKDSTKYRQFIQAKNLLHSYFVSREATASMVFDYDKFAYWDAVGTYTAGTHGHELHNQRFYYNPTTSLLEPVGFDALGYYRTEQPFEVHYTFPEDQLYRNLVLTKLNELMKMSYGDIQRIFLQQNFMEASDILSSEYSEKPQELKDAMRKQIQKITGTYNYSHPMDIYLEEMDNDKIVLNFRNVTKLDIEILGVKYKKKDLVGLSERLFVREDSFKKDTLDIREGAYNVFFDRTTKKTDRSKFQDITIIYRTVGTDEIKTEKIIPYPYYDPTYVQQDIMRKKIDLSRFAFLSVDESKKTVHFVKADTPWVLAEPIRIAKGYTVVVPAGFMMDIQEGGFIISKSPVFFNGEKESPIKIFSSSGKGGGIVILQSPERSSIKNASFDRLRNPVYGNWSVTGAITFYESPVELKNVTFSNNFCEDALNIVRTHFSMENANFYNTRSDAFDGDFVTGDIVHSSFENLGNDGIDVSGSDITLNAVMVTGAGDKAISIGEKSKADVKRTKIMDSEIGVNTKDLSTTSIDGLEIENTRLAFTAFQKKEEYGAGRIVAHNVRTIEVDELYLIEEHSSMALNGKEILTKVRAVKDKMYGNDYGRKSER